MRVTGYVGMMRRNGPNDGGEDYVGVYADTYEHRPMLVRVGFNEAVPTPYGILENAAAVVMAMEVETARALRRQLADLLDRIDMDALRPEDSYDYDPDEEDDR